MAVGADPRPLVEGGRIVGSRCTGCAYPAAPTTRRCVRCGGPQARGVFGPDGTAWASTVIRIPVGDREPPYGLALVDLDDGPRILAHLDRPEAVPPGARVRLVGASPTGDPVVTTTGGMGDVEAGGRPAAGPPSGLASLSRPVAVSGVGTSSFGRFRDQRPEELAWEAVEEALNDSGVRPENVEAVWVGSVFAPGALIPRVLRGLGIGGVPVLRVENACASGTSAFHEAVHAVGSGRVGFALALGVEQLSTAFTGPIVPDATDPEGATGLAMPGLYALQASRYLALHPAVEEADLAAVAVKNKANGARNPRAQLRQAPSLDEVLSSRMIADPLTFLQCCPLGDGAAAAIIGTDGPVRVRSSVLASGDLWDHRTPELWGEGCVGRAALGAYEAAGLGPSDIDVLEVHDAFTIGEVATLEALGLAEPGQGAGLAGTGHTAIGGRQPVNPSGGLLARGHPLGATGLAQVAELTWQLRGMAGERQVEGARTALVETMGGGAAGVDGNASVVAILEGS
jgi:acetyl-CoA acetyltransferase/uncharacterized OB-fold protein